jgi:hypothetical protein
MGGTATLFSKTGEDYIRVSTNVIKNGERAIGTKLAPDGKAIKKLNQQAAKQKQDKSPESMYAEMHNSCG